MKRGTKIDREIPQYLAIIISLNKQSIRHYTGIKPEILRALITCMMINASGRRINFTNMLSFYAKFMFNNVWKYRVTKHIKQLIELGYLRHDSSPTNEQRRQHYILTASAITTMDKLVRSVRNQVTNLSNY